MTQPTGPVTPLEVKAVWDATPKPSARKVADRMKAAGRSVSFKSVAKWKRENWGLSLEQVAHAVEKANDKLDQQAAMVTGDPTANAEDVQPVIPALADETPTVAVGEDALRDTLHTARNLLAVMNKTAPTQMLSPAVAGVFMKDLANAVSMCVDALVKLPAIRMNDAKLINGQDVIPPETEKVRAFLEKYEPKKDAA